MIKRYVLKWAKDEILTFSTGHINRIDFLFFFECRELNTTPNIPSPEELLKTKYPDILRHIDISDLQTIADRVMIVVDGLDELQGMYDVEDSEDTSPTTITIKHLIDTNSTMLKGHQTIVCGRPKACGFLQTKMKGQKMKCIEVCGFDQKKTIEYIERFFKNDLPRAKQIKEIVKRPIIRILSGVPVFLWIICLLYSEDFEEEITSVTELYTYALVTFLQKHLRGCNKTFEKQSLSTLTNTKEFAEIVFSLAKLSCKMYMEHKIIFTDDDIKDIKCSIPLEKTGFISKYSVGKLAEETYQFKHLAFQEHLCALYICLVKDVSQYNTDRELSSCITTILGLRRLVEEGKNQLFVAFYQRLEMVYKTSETWKERLSLTKTQQNTLITEYTTLINKRLLDTQNEILKKIKEKDARHVLLCDPYDETLELMREFREYGWLLEESFSETIRTCAVDMYASPSKSPEILDFLRSLKINQIFRLTLYILDVGKEFITEADYGDLISMVEKQIPKTAAICYYPRMILHQRFTVSRGPHAVEIHIVKRSEYKLSAKMKEPFDSFIIELLHIDTIGVDEVNDCHIFIADIIDHMMASQGRKTVVIEPVFRRQGDFEIWSLLKQRIHNEFSHMEHFDKIEIRDQHMHIF